MIFYIIICTIYFSLHAYIFCRLCLAFKSRWWRIPLGIFFLLMALSWAGRNKASAWPILDPLMYFSAYWTGALLLFILFLSCFDFIRYLYSILFKRKALKASFAEFKKSGVFFPLGVKKTSEKSSEKPLNDRQAKGKEAPKNPEFISKSPEFISKKPEFTSKSSGAISKSPVAIYKAPELISKKPEFTSKSSGAIFKSLGAKFFGLFFFTIKEQFRSRSILQLSLLITFLIVPYSIWEAYNFNYYKEQIYTDKLPKSVDSLRLLIVADLHINPLLPDKHLEKIVEMINKAEADLFFSVGDLIDGQEADKESAHKTIKILQGIKAKYGKFAVLGNQEYYYEWDKAIAFQEAAGLKILRGEKVDIGGISLVGLDDRWARRVGLKIEDAEDFLPKVRADGKYLICLNHRPEILEGSLGYFDLQISGHSHGGQIFPLGLIYEFFKLFPAPHLVRVDAEYFKKSGAAYSPDFEERNLAGKNFGQDIKAWDERSADEKRSPAYVFTTVGLGFKNPPLRFLTPPEIVIIDLVRGEPENHSH